MRVLHISSGNLYGGIESMLATMARYRHECPQLEPEVALAFEGRLSEELRATGMPVHILGSVRASRPHTVFRARAALRDLLRRSRFDVAICHAPWPHAVFGPSVQRAGVPLVFWAHGPISGKHWIERWASRTRPVLAISNSAFTEASVRAKLPGIAVRVVPCPVSGGDTGQDHVRRSARAQHAVPAGAKVILQVSRLEPWKGQMLLLEALGQIADRDDWVCWLVGCPQNEREQSYRDSLSARADRLGLGGRVKVIETPGNVRHLYEAADIYCQPNLEAEPFGITLVEAMLAGVPVVTSDLGGPREFIDQCCGFRVPARDMRAVAMTLDQLLSDGELRSRLGGAGRLRARERFSPLRQLSRLADSLSDIAAIQAAVQA